MQVMTEKNRKAVMAFLLFVLVAPAAMSRKPDEVEGGIVNQENCYSPGPPSPPRCGTPSGGGGHGGAPSHGGRGYYAPPLVPVITTQPPTPTVTPSPLVPLVPPAPTRPVTPTPPATPLFPVNPNIFPFTCDYWRTHPAAIWGVIGYWGTVGQIFGLPAVAAYGSNPSLAAALANTRRDGIGALYREGTASLLNSLVNRSFVFSAAQVKDAFIASTVSERAAAAQAQLFKKANEGHLKH